MSVVDIHAISYRPTWAEPCVKTAHDGVAISGDETRRIIRVDDKDGAPTTRWREGGADRRA